MRYEEVQIAKVKVNPNNPRICRDDKFAKLVKSIKEFPEMLKLRPIVVNDDMIVLGGNMRLKACKEAGLKVVPVIKASELSEEQQREFIIKDNVGFGEWDWEMLGNEWEAEKLEEWGLEVPGVDDEDPAYSTKIDSPIYTPKGPKPNVFELFDVGKYEALMNEISKQDLDENTRLFLQLAASRHIKFDYAKIAEYYSHSDETCKALIESSALVIIDYDKAIEDGFVKLFETLEVLSDNDK